MHLSKPEGFCPVQGPNSYLLTCKHVNFSRDLNEKQQDNLPSRSMWKGYLLLGPTFLCSQLVSSNALKVTDLMIPEHE